MTEPTTELSQGLVILDRDGVINVDRADYVLTPAQWQPIPGSLEAIARLTDAGYLVGVATNQSAIGRGLLTEDELGEIHVRMQEAVRSHGGRIDHVAHCPHAPSQSCTCRKPAPGLLRQIADALGAELADGVFVGDSLRDLQAARAVHCRPILVRTGHGSEITDPGDDVACFEDLAAFVDALLEGTAEGPTDGSRPLRRSAVTHERVAHRE